jgi:hypothetical protein
MLVSDLTVEVRNANFERVGQLSETELVGLTLVGIFCNVGSWSITLPSTSRLVDDLRAPGAGIIVTAYDQVIFSGYTVSATLEQSTDNSLGDWKIQGVDDSVILGEHLAYPLPSTADVTAQTVASDTRTGAAETVMKGYVQDNISAVAGTSRAIANLVVEEDLSRGELVTGSARFVNLQELLYGLAQTGKVGFNVEQSGDLLEFKVYEPIDRSATVRMDLDNGQLTRTEYSYGQPRATRVIVGGPGEAEERVFYEGTTEASLEAESIWARRVEKFIDSRGGEAEDVLQQSANEALVDDGKTIVNMSVTPADDLTMRYGIDWNLGDKVTIVVGLVETTAVVTEIGISVQADGIRIGATVGDPAPVAFESKLLAVQQSQSERISNLERNTTGYGVNTVYQPEGGTNGTQPTFSGPAIEGSYNRFGNLIHFSIRVTFTNITSFGTGQYYLQLPHPARVAYQFRDGCLHDASANAEYQMSGHVNAGSDILWLNFADKIASGVQDADFTYSTPVTLTTADSFHIAGLYEIDN